MEKVFISVNAEGHLIIKPAKDRSADQAAEDSPTTKPVSKSPHEPGALDSRGRLKLPADIRRFLRGDDDPA